MRKRPARLRIGREKVDVNGHVHAHWRRAKPPPSTFCLSTAALRVGYSSPGASGWGRGSNATSKRRNCTGVQLRVAEKRRAAHFASHESNQDKSLTTVTDPRKCLPAIFLLRVYVATLTGTGGVFSPYVAIDAFRNGEIPPLRKIGFFLS